MHTSSYFLKKHTNEVFYVRGMINTSYDPRAIRSGGSVKKVLYNRVYLSTIFSILIYTFIPL